MAFSKVSVLLLALLAVATIAETAELWSKCECKEESGTTKCYRYDRKVGGCPLVCGSPCPCTRSIPPICWCTYEVDTCSPKQWPQNAATKLENLLTLDGIY